MKSVYPTPEATADALCRKAPGTGKIAPVTRVAWLIANQNLWTGLYPEYDSPSARLNSLLRLARHAQREGLYAKTTYLPDVARSLAKYVALARSAIRFKIDVAEYEHVVEKQQQRRGR